MAADANTRLSTLVARLEADPAALAQDRDAGDQLALEIGGELALRWRIAVVRGLIDVDPDTVREAYGELVDRYRDDAASLTHIKPLGDEIRRHESDGSLPSTLVARSDRRAKTQR